MASVEGDSVETDSGSFGSVGDDNSMTGLSTFDSVTAGGSAVDESGTGFAVTSVAATLGAIKVVMVVLPMVVDFGTDFSSFTDTHLSPFRLYPLQHSSTIRCLFSTYSTFQKNFQFNIEFKKKTKNGKYTNPNHCFRNIFVFI